VDVNPRAIDFCRFNRALNALPSAEYALGDLYESCPVATRYDMVVSNPPYVPSIRHPAGTTWFSGGPTGDAVLSRIVAGLDAHLSDDGTALLYAMLVHHDDIPYRDKIDAWLGGLDSWDVTVRAVPFGFQPTEALDPLPSHYELALIAVRRCAAGAGRYERIWGLRD
jgi:methylase of polypeptide subunit release factors